jgi:uncharacterized membrane protein YfcA
MDARTIILLLIALITVLFIAGWFVLARRRLPVGDPGPVAAPTPFQLGLGFVTNFFDTLGIGSFAPTASVFKLRGMVPDQQIPGTLNVGHTLPSIAEALIFIAAVQVEPLTLCLMIAAAVAGAWLGAGVVAGWPRRAVQIGMGLALVAAASLFLMTNFGLFPAGGNSFALSGAKLAVGVFGNFMLGAFMTLGIGLFGPCMILVALLGMNPIAAFPIMMGSCAFLMPVAGLRFVQAGGYRLQPALGLAIGGIPGVLIAAYIVKSLNVFYLRWLVVIVVLYAAITMLRSAYKESHQTATLKAAEAQS